MKPSYRTHAFSFLASALVLAGCSLKLGESTTDSTRPSSTDPVPQDSPSETPSMPSISQGCTKTAPVTANETWGGAACPSGIHVTQPIEINGAGVELTIEAGTRVYFESAGSLTVTPGAALIARGTAERKVTFTGWQAAAGAWPGITLKSNNLKNELTHTIIEYAGADDRAALRLIRESTQNASASFHDIEIRNSKGTGLLIDSESKIRAAARVSIHDNAGGGAGVYPASAEQLTSFAHAFTNNGPGNLVRIYTSQYESIDKDTTWPNVAPAIYRVENDRRYVSDAIISVEAHLTIEAGAIFEMPGGSGFLLDGGASGLKAVGEPGKPIIFRGISDSSWGGFSFKESAWSENRLEYVEVRNAADPHDWQYWGKGRVASIFLWGFSTEPSLSVANLTVAGPNAAPADISVKDASKLHVSGVNKGRGADGALDISTR